MLVVKHTGSGKLNPNTFVRCKISLRGVSMKKHGRTFKVLNLSNDVPESYFRPKVYSFSESKRRAVDVHWKYITQLDTDPKEAGGRPAFEGIKPLNQEQRDSRVREQNVKIG